MFGDLVGSTALAARLDPEEMRERHRAYQDAVAGEVTRFDGHVAKFMGDGVLAYFGCPTAHEDDAERAVRAGLGFSARSGASPAGRPAARGPGRHRHRPRGRRRLVGRARHGSGPSSARRPTSPPGCRAGRTRRGGHRRRHAPALLGEPVRARGPRPPAEGLRGAGPSLGVVGEPAEGRFEALHGSPASRRSSAASMSWPSGDRWQHAARARARWCSLRRAGHRQVAARARFTRRLSSERYRARHFARLTARTAAPAGRRAARARRRPRPRRPAERSSKSSRQCSARALNPTPRQQCRPCAELLSFCRLNGRDPTSHS